MASKLLVWFAYHTVFGSVFGSARRRPQVGAVLNLLAGAEKPQKPPDELLSPRLSAPSQAGP